MFNKYKKRASPHFLPAAPDTPQIYDLLQLSCKEREARRAAVKAIMTYRLLRRERVHAFQDYMESLPGRGNIFATAAR